MYAEAHAAVLASVFYALYLTVFFFTDRTSVVMLTESGITIGIWICFLVLSVRATKALHNNEVTLSSLQLFIDDNRYRQDD